MSAGRLLVVEDDASLRQLLSKYLSRLAYQVDSAGSAEEALPMLKGPAGVYALCLIDLTLPGMRGDELMGLILAADEKPRVLISSGYAYEFPDLPAQYRDRVGFLQKPYLPRQLADQIQSMLQAGLSKVGA